MSREARKYEVMTSREYEVMTSREYEVMTSVPPEAGHPTEPFE